MSVLDRRLPSLDGMRGISIFLVLFAHVAGTSHAYGLSILHYTGELGLFGVKVFFVISGFLITRLLLREKEETGRISLKGFYLRRVRRIFPAFYVFLLCAWGLTQAHLLLIPPADFVHSATFTANVTPMSWELLHIWSLSVEEQFYLVWPALLICFGTRWAIRFMTVIMVISPLAFAFGFHEHVRLGQAMSGLAAGCVLADRRPALHRNIGYWSFVNGTWTALALTVLLFLLESLRRFPTYEVLTPVISIALALLLDSVLSFPQSFVGKLLNWRPVVYVGVLSYSIYLWQQIFLNPWGTRWFNVFPLSLICVAILALGSYYLVERPFLSKKMLHNQESASNSGNPKTFESTPATFK